MEKQYRNRTATVVCENCGETCAVKVWSTGMIEPIDRTNLCSCDTFGLRIVSPDPDADDE